MIDYVKILIQDIDIDSLLNHPDLTFSSEVSQQTGELIEVNKRGEYRQPRQEAYYKGLKFSVYESGSVYLAGSLHYYFNDGEHNYNDFSLSDAIKVTQELERIFTFSCRLTQMRSVEIGINIPCPLAVNSLLDNCFMHKTKAFEYKHHSAEGRYKQCEHSQYIIKLYNKALQFRSKGAMISEEILRFEKKYTKMEILNKRNIYSLDDLLKSNFEQHKNDLLKAWDEILYFDNSLSLDSTKLLRYSNPIHWSQLLEDNRTETFKKQRQELRMLNTQSDKLFHNSIRTQIEQKTAELSFIP